MTELPFRGRIVQRATGGLLAGTLLLGCVGDPAPLPASTWLDAGAGLSAAPTVETCAAPGAVVRCSNVATRHPDYVVCSDGQRSCESGVWGPCVPNGSLRVQSLGLRLQAPVGTPMDCQPWNPCDPYCLQIHDEASDVDAGDGSSIVVSDAGVTLPRLSIGGTAAYGCTELRITAGPATITVTGLSPLVADSVKLSASLLPDGCYPAGAPPVLWGVDRYDVATVSGDGTLTLLAPTVGPIRVFGYAGELSASAPVTVKVDVIDQSQAPSGAENSFQGAGSATDTATVLYPYPNTVFPLGLPAPLVQWAPGNAGAGQAAQLTLRYPRTGTPLFRWAEIVPATTSLSLGTSTLAGSRATIPQAAWALFERAALGDDAAIVLQRLTGATLLSEIETPVHFATERLRGTIYYQSFGTSLVQNYTGTYEDTYAGYGMATTRFGVATLALHPGDAQPTPAAGFTYSGSGGCRGCHRASADGQTLLVNTSSSSKKQSLLLEVGVDSPSEGTAIGSGTGRFSWGAVYPDGSLLFSHIGPPSDGRYASSPGALDGSYDCSFSSYCGSRLYSLDASTWGQTLTAGIPTGLRAALPAFSRDGTKVAFNHYGGPDGSSLPGDQHSLALLDFDTASGQFSGLRRLVTESDQPCNTNFHPTDRCTPVWPSFLPDGSAVLYEREVFNNGRVPNADRADFGATRSGCDQCYPGDARGDQGSRGELWWVDTAAATPPARLSAANGSPGNSLAIPTGANGHTDLNEAVLNYQPRVSPQPAGGYHWVIFTSRRLYGNVATMNPWWSDPRYKPLAGENGATPKKLWVAALDLNAPAGTDPSHPAFFLPGQELLAANGQPSWVQELCRPAGATCETDLDCCGAPASAVCSVVLPLSNPAVRRCVSPSHAACVPSSPTACNGAAAGSRCANGTCRMPPAPWSYVPAEFTRDFVDQCPANFARVWRELQCQADAPTGTGIDFRVTSADTEAGLDAISPPVLALTAVNANPSVWQSSLPVDQLLNDAGVIPGRYLRIIVRLWPSADGLRAPTLSEWRQLYDCYDVH